MVENITATKTVKASGNSMVVYLTSELKVMGISEGDTVEITVRRLKND